jgi:ABC-type sulfate/molybdate transport systems ATPase subunit
MDEPTSALDEEVKEEVEALILQIVRQNALTCLIVSHDLAQATRIASRVRMIKAGRLAKIGSATEVIHVTGNLHEPTGFGLCSSSGDHGIGAPGDAAGAAARDSPGT